MVNDIFCVFNVINDETGLLCKGFLFAVNIVNEIHKRCLSFCWSEGHDSVCPLDGITTLEGKLFLTG
jgi:hypothetical protein